MPISNKNSITTKVNLIFFVFGFLLLLSFLFPAYKIGRSILEEKAVSELNSISIQKQLTLKGWLSYTETFINGLARSHGLRENLSYYFDAPEGSAGFNQRQQAINNLGDELSGWVQTDNGFDTISVVDQKSGTVIASTQASEIGRNDFQQLYFQNGKTGLYVQSPYLSTNLSNPFLRIALPVTALDGQAKAVLAVQIHINKIIDIVQRGSDNTSADFYLINHEKQIVVPPKLLPNAAILVDTIQNQVVDRCILGESGQMTSQDYREVSVITTYAWLPDLNLCLIVEKDRGEAYADITRFSGNVVLSAVILSCFGLFLTLILSSTITKPIYHLLHHVEMFGKGESDLIHEENRDDEIGLLFHAFHKMATNLSETIDQLKSTAEENLLLYKRASYHARQLEEEKALVSKLLDTSSNLIVILDPQGKVLQHNKTVEIMTGYDHDDIQGKAYFDLSQSPNGVLGPVNPIDRLVNGEFPNYIEQDFTDHRGEKKRITWSSDALFDSYGVVEFIICIGTDITEQKQVEEQLRKSERNFQLAVAAAPISVYTTDREYQITFMHDPHTDFDQSRYIGKQVDCFLPSEAAEKIFAIQKSVLETGCAQRGLISVNFFDETIYYNYFIKPIMDASGSVTGLACAAYDITEQKKVEQALVEIKNNLEQTVIERTRELRFSQTILQTTLDALPEIASLIDRDGKILFGNKALAERFQVPMEQLLGENVYDFLSPDVAVYRKGKAEQAFLTGQAVRFVDFHNGRYFDSAFHPLISENKRDYMLAVLAIDVTDWKLAQDAIAAGRERLKELARKVVVAQEEERQRISRELHDEAGQALTALSISLKLFSDDLPENYDEMKHRLGDAVSLVSSTMDRIRLLAQDLRPQALDTMGIHQAMEGYCREFTRRTRIEIDYQSTEIPQLPDITSITFYRVLQEALTNAAKHSQTNRIKVSLTFENNTICLRVQDFGVGFVQSVNNPNDAGSVFQGIGLAGMNERIEMIGGKLDIKSSPGEGTILVAIANINGDPIERRIKHDQSRYRG